MDLSKNKPELVDAYEGYAADYRAKYGRQPTITSAARTDAKQAELYSRWQAGDAGVYMPAKPRGDGSVRHDHALDISQADIDESLLKKNNLWRPFGAKDPVHVELVGSKNGKPVGTTTGTMMTQDTSTQRYSASQVAGIDNILALLSGGQAAARAEGSASGEAAYQAGVTAQARSRRQEDYLAAAGLNTPSDPSFLQTMMVTHQEAMVQHSDLVKQRDQWLAQMGPMAGVLEVLGGKGASTFMFDPQIEAVQQSLKESQAAMQSYLANTSTVATMGQGTIARVSMAEAMAQQKALEAKAEQHAVDYGFKANRLALEAEAISTKATGSDAGKALIAMGLDPAIAKISGGNQNTKAVVDAILRNPTAVAPDNRDPKLNSVADALVIYSQAMQGATNPILGEYLDNAFGASGYAAGAMRVAKTTFNAQKQVNKKYQGLTQAREAEEIGNMTRLQADQQMTSIDPRDDTNMYRADWNSMSTAKGASVFRGPIGQQVLADLGRLTAGEARKTYNDRIVLERAVQLVKSGAITIDGATEELSSMFAGAVKFNNAINKYDAVGLLPQTSYMSTLRSKPADGLLGGYARSMIGLVSRGPVPAGRDVSITNLAENAVNGKSVAPGIDMTDPAIVRRTLLGELIADRVAAITSVPRPNSATGAASADTDPLQPTTPER